MRFKLVMTFAALTLCAVSSWAYIPKFWMILSRTAETHGKGPYLIEQDVVFQHGLEPQIVHEQWLIENGEAMRVVVTGRKSLKDRIRMTAVYEGRNKFFVDANGVRKTIKAGKDWFEPFFHFRLSAKMKPVMQSLQMIPAEALEMPGKPRSLREVKHEPENFLRLSRVQGRIAYGIGTPTPVGASEAYSGLWIEQDAFNVLKIRFPSQAVVTADAYGKFDKDLWLPRYRDVRWDANTVRINVIKVASVATGPRVKASLSPSSLDFGKDPNVTTVLPEDPVIRDFYTRFR